METAALHPPIRGSVWGRDYSNNYRTPVLSQPRSRSPSTSSGGVTIVLFPREFLGPLACRAAVSITRMRLRRNLVSQAAHQFNTQPRITSE